MITVGDSRVLGWRFLTGPNDSRFLTREQSSRRGRETLHVSWVANLMLSVSWEEDRSLVEEFSNWLRHDAPWNEPSVPPGATGVGFLRNLMESPATSWGGWKNPEGLLFACATNHADIDAIVDKFGAMPWRRADVVQLLIKDQEQEFFRLWMIVDGEGAQLTSAQPSGCEDADR